MVRAQKGPLFHLFLAKSTAQITLGTPAFSSSVQNVLNTRVLFLTGIFSSSLPSCRRFALHGLNPRRGSRSPPSP